MRRGSSAQRGQSLTEFALIAPLFFLLIFGVIQMGILFGGQIGLTNAAREVARYASTVPANQSLGTIQAQATPVLRRSIPGYTGTAVIGASYCYYQNSTTPDTTPTATWSWKVSITIRYGHTLFVPLVGRLIDGFDTVVDNKYTVTAKEEMRVETLPLKSQPTGTACGANP